jgi:hypothetical protein
MRKLGFEIDQNFENFLKFRIVILTCVGFCDDFENAKMSRLKMIQNLKPKGGVFPWQGWTVTRRLNSLETWKLDDKIISS